MKYKDAVRLSYVIKLWSVAVISIVSIVLTASMAVISTKLTLFAAFAGIAACVVVVFFFTRKINEDTSNLTRVSKNLAQETDLSVRVSSKAKNEIGTIGRFLDSFLTELSTSLTKIQVNAQNLFESSALISSNSAQMAISADEQTEKTTLMSIAIEQLNENVDQIALNATNAQSESAHVFSLAVKGEETVTDAKESIVLVEQTIHDAMGMIINLENQSEEIDSIISVIEGIAEQTNLLALNAAIEAARAGEQGRGFAVVADEVRNLAARTRDATIDVTKKIGSIRSAASKTVGQMKTGQEQITQGVELTQQVVASLGEITQSAKSMDQLTNGIALATGEQSSSVQHIRENVHVISTAAKENTSSINFVNENILNLLNHAIELNDELSEYSCVARTPLNEIHLRMLKIRRNAVLAAVSLDTESVKIPIETIYGLDKEIESNWNKYQSTKIVSKDGTLIRAYTDAWATFLDARKITLSYSTNGEFSNARGNAVNNAGPKFKLALQALLDLIGSE